MNRSLSNYSHEVDESEDEVDSPTLQNNEVIGNNIDTENGIHVPNLQNENIGDNVNQEKEIGEERQQEAPNEYPRRSNGSRVNPHGTPWTFQYN